MKTILKLLMSHLLNNPHHVSRGVGHLSKLTQWRALWSRYKTPIIGAIGCLSIIVIVAIIGLIALVGTLLGNISPDTLPDISTLSGAVAAIENPIQVQEGGVFIDIPYLNDLINRIRPYIQFLNTL